LKSFRIGQSAAKLDENVMGSYHHIMEEEQKQYRCASYAKHREARVKKMRDRYAKHKSQVFDHYGNKCGCCGESEPLFLTIDHIENDGYLHRKRKEPGGSAHGNIYGWLCRNGFPEGFQVLCMNCNQGKHRNKGICPHQEGSTISERAACR
jgi:hypothetical protein